MRTTLMARRIPPTISRLLPIFDCSRAVSRMAATGGTRPDRSAGSRADTTVTTNPTINVTTIVREYPTGEGDPYYPIPRPQNAELYRRYERLAAATPGVRFIGRLATYRYYNMDQVIAQALVAHRRIETESGRAA